MSVPNLQRILEARAAQAAQKTAQSQDNRKELEELVKAVVMVVEQSNRQVHEMLRAVADNQKLLHTTLLEIKKGLEQKNAVGEDPA